MRFDHFQMVRPCQGERVSGDTAVVKPLERGLLIAIVDVSGHGPEAHQLAQRLEKVISEWPDGRLRNLMERLHEVSRQTRGAAVGLAYFDDTKASLRYVGVGNTRACRLGHHPWHGVSRDGVLGSRFPTVREETLDLKEGEVLAFYTDGLKEHISFRDHPQLPLGTPRKIAADMIRLFGRDYDDASCIVIKCRA